MGGIVQVAPFDCRVPAMAEERAVEIQPFGRLAPREVGHLAVSQSDPHGRPRPRRLSGEDRAPGWRRECGPELARWPAILTMEDRKCA